MSLDRPIFIVGTGRCGSTLLHEIMARHPGLAYLSRLCSGYPANPAINRRGMEALDWPVVGGFAQERLWPTEAWEFWEHHVSGFRNPFRDLVAADVTPPVKARVDRVLASMLTPQRSRMLIKLTGWPRTGFVSAIFPDARYVHVIRDGRSVASSLLNVDFWDGWRGPPTWRWGALAPALQSEWEASGKSFVVLAAIQWKLLMDSFELAKQSLPPGQLLEVRYEDLVAGSEQVIARILDFCQIDNPDSFRAHVRSVPMRESNRKWRDGLTTGQQAAMEDALRAHLLRYGYAVG